MTIAIQDRPTKNLTMKISPLLFKSDLYAFNEMPMKIAVFVSVVGLYLAHTISSSDSLAQQPSAYSR